MTERLYLQDAYLATFSARILERVLMPAGKLAVVLDRTAFFPGAVGFPADRGWLNQVEISEIILRPEDGEVLHVLSEEVWENQVQAQVDWPRRLDLMRQHTAGHLLADALAHTCGATTVSIHASDAQAFLELDTREITPAQLEQTEAAANHVALSRRAVRAALVTAAQAAKLGLVPLSPEGYLLPGTATVQVVSIEGASPILCEGLHVAQTGEIGLIKVLGLEPRGERLRIGFAAGPRALTEFRRMEQTLAQLAASLNVPAANVLPAVARLMSDLIATRQELENVRGSIATFEAEALAASAQDTGGVKCVWRVYAERDIAALRQLARLVVARPGYVVMLGTAGGKAQLILARSANVRYDMTIPIRLAAQVLTTQGGGQPAWAETIPVRADEARVEAAIVKVVRWLQSQP